MTDLTPAQERALLLLSADGAHTKLRGNLTQAAKELYEKYLVSLGMNILGDGVCSFALTPAGIAARKQLEADRG